MIPRAPRTPPPRVKPPSMLKTYSHLAGLRRMPSEYEVATTELLPYLRKGFEVNAPLASWYARYQSGSPLALPQGAWESFADPRETTYPKYTRLRHAREVYVDGVLEAIDREGYDLALAPEWRATLARAFAPLRYPFHGMQMVSAYVGHMAPAGRIAITSLFQAGDEIRRIQRVAYRMTQIAQHHAGFGQSSKTIWQEDRALQPLREAIERLFVAYDWGEAFTALNLCVKPLVDHVVLEKLAEAGRAQGDYQLGAILGSFGEDCEWHRAWACALARTAIAGREENRAVMRAWADAWTPIALAAAEGYGGLLPTAPSRVDLERVLAAHLAAAGVTSS